jgi:hypothetical protein
VKFGLAREVKRQRDVHQGPVALQQEGFRALEASAADVAMRRLAVALFEGSRTMILLKQATEAMLSIGRHAGPAPISRGQQQSFASEIFLDGSLGRPLVGAPSGLLLSKPRRDRLLKE